MLWKVDDGPAATWTHLVGQVNEPPPCNGVDVKGTQSACVKCKQPWLGHVITLFCVAEQIRPHSITSSCGWFCCGFQYTYPSWLACEELCIPLPTSVLECELWLFLG